MAIPQERFIKITSSMIGESAIGERDLNGLVFTQGKGWLPSLGVFGTDEILKCYNVDEVLKYFSSASEEAKFARKYFSYISPSGTSPASLSFARVKVTNTSGSLLTYIDGWYTPATNAWAVATFSSNPTNTSKIKVYLGASTDVVFEGKFVTGARTSTTDIKIGTTLAETVKNFADTINGVAGFYGQTANEKVKAEIDSTNPLKVKLTAIRVGSQTRFDVTVPGSPPSSEDSLVDSDKGLGANLGTDEEDDPEIESAVDAFSRINAGTNNFGSFTFIDLTSSAANDISSVAKQNARYNYKYLYCPGIKKGVTQGFEYDGVTTVASTCGEVNGTALELGVDGLAGAIPMAISAAIDYGGTNTAPNYMFKQIAGEVATVEDNETADMLDSMHINYYGKTQANGRELSFFQRGFNLDGEDIAVYFNEVWLKSHIATALFNLFLAVERIPANDDGEALVYTEINAAVQDGVRNGVIEIGKTFDATQRAAIYQITGDAEAYLTIQRSGFWLGVAIEHSGNEYYAKYVLVYGKGDSIRKVEGRDLLV